jgi:hypothetical protein
MEQEGLDDYGYSYIQHAEATNVVLEALQGPSGPAEPAPQNERGQVTAAVAAAVMQHSLALASCIGSLVIVLATIGLGESLCKSTGGRKEGRTVEDITAWSMQDGSCSGTPH